jgi:Phosphoesterase family
VAAIRGRDAVGQCQRHSASTFIGTQSGYTVVGEPPAPAPHAVRVLSPAAAGISWQVYQEEDNYDDKALAWSHQCANAPTAAGAEYVAQKLDAIASNPDVWAKTLFILACDENDGMFDHVPPPTPPAGTADEFVTVSSPGGTAGDGLPIGPGFRVPVTLVPPWTVGGNIYYLLRCSSIRPWSA